MLSGVPETALWTLYHRALAARKGVLDDPKAIELVDRIDHPFQERFGKGELAAFVALAAVLVLAGGVLVELLAAIVRAL